MINTSGILFYFALIFFYVKMQDSCPLFTFFFKLVSGVHHQEGSFQAGGSLNIMVGVCEKPRSRDWWVRKTGKWLADFSGDSVV